jgi:hypothetical protein
MVLVRWSATGDGARPGAQRPGHTRRALSMHRHQIGQSLNKGRLLTSSVHAAKAPHPQLETYHLITQGQIATKPSGEP